MNTFQNLLANLCSVFDYMGEVLRYASISLRTMVCPNAVLAASLLAAESQPAVCTLPIQQTQSFDALLCERIVKGWPQISMTMNDIE